LHEWIEAEKQSSRFEDEVFEVAATAVMVSKQNES
jgi:hypothetical protein